MDAADFKCVFDEENTFVMLVYELKRSDAQTIPLNKESSSNTKLTM